MGYNGTQRIPNTGRGIQPFLALLVLPLRNIRRQRIRVTWRQSIVDCE